MDNIFDLHIYTNNSGHGNDKVSFLCETAVAAGLRAVAFTDDCKVETFENYDTRRRLRHAYFDAAKAKQVFVDSLMVLLGVELDGAVFRPDLAKRVLELQKYDIVLACVSGYEHQTDFSLCYGCPQADFDDFARRYTALLVDTVKKVDFDALSNVLSPLKNLNCDLGYFERCFTPVLEALAQRGKALEITAADLLGSEAVRDLYQRLITRFKAVGGEYLTVGSAGRYYEDVGSGLDIALQAAKRGGFTQITLYEQRTPYLFQI